MGQEMERKPRERQTQTDKEMGIERGTLKNRPGKGETYQGRLDNKASLQSGLVQQKPRARDTNPGQRDMERQTYRQERTTLGRKLRS